MRLSVWCCTLFALLCFAVPAFAEPTTGGVFFDNITVTNNGKTLLSDSFDTGKLDGWNVTRPRVCTVPTSEKPASYCLYLNRLNDINTAISRPIKCDDIGEFEIKTYVYLPSPEEQWGWSHNSMERTRFEIRTGRDQDWFYIALDLRPKENGYRAELVYIKPELKEPCGGGAKFPTSGPVIAPNRWALVSFKLDPTTSTATVSVDGRPQVSCQYEPEKISKLTTFYILTWMGNEKTTAKPGKCVNP